MGDEKGSSWKISKTGMRLWSEKLFIHVAAEAAQRWQLAEDAEA
jgi:hypothetical protein